MAGETVMAVTTDGGNAATGGLRPTRLAPGGQQPKRKACTCVNLMGDSSHVVVLQQLGKNAGRLAFLDNSYPLRTSACNYSAAE